MTSAVANVDQLLDEYVDALDAGDEAGALEVARRIPLHPSLAKGILAAVGKDALLANFDLSEANAVFGEAWIDG